jgi:adenylate kinase family enzyme
VSAATEGDGWITDSTYHRMLGDLVSSRADLIVWLDLPIPLVMWRLLRRTCVRNRDKVELWEPGFRESMRYLIWPALKRAFANRRDFQQSYAHLRVSRLRSDAEVRTFVQSIQATATMSGSSKASPRQNTPPLADT